MINAVLIIGTNVGAVCSSVDFQSSGGFIADIMKQLCDIADMLKVDLHPHQYFTSSTMQTRHNKKSNDEKKTKKLLEEKQEMLNATMRHY